MLPIRDQIMLELHKIIALEVFDEWLNSPNMELDLRTPRELLRKHEYTPLWTLIYNQKDHALASS